MNGERAGIVNLRDLASRGAWEPFRLQRFLDANGLVPAGDVTRRFEPPRVLVVVVSIDDALLVRRARGWLAEAERVIVFREPSDLAVDPELAEVIEEEWRDVIAGLPAVIIDDAERALAEARPTARLRASRTTTPSIDALPVSAWSAYSPERFDWAFLERVERRGDEIIIHEPIPRPQLTPEEARAQRGLTPGFLALGADPFHPVRWRGNRMTVYWNYRDAYLSVSDHDYPCGPGKKLYGYDDNDPVQVCLAPDASMYVARFDHDVLVTSAVPIPWQRAGDFDVAVRTPDAYRAVFYAQDPAQDETRPRPTDVHDEDGRDLAPALVLGPGCYAVDLRFRVYRITTDEKVVHIGGPEEGFAVFDLEHRELRRARGRLIGGWFRWATIEDDGAYWREDLVTGSRERVAPIDLTLSDDPAIAAVARDATLEGNHDLAGEIAKRGPSHEVGEVRVYALAGTRNVLLVGATHARVI